MENKKWTLPPIYFSLDNSYQVKGFFLVKLSIKCLSCEQTYKPGYNDIHITIVN